MKTSFTKLSMIVAASIAAGTAMATPYGNNITISDKNNDGGAGWYSNREDQEVETNPNTVTQQQWDMEGMFLSGSTLTLVGGYDFKNGVTWTNGHNYSSGDIFVDVDGDAKYGWDSSDALTGGETTNSFGYDYVLDLDLNSMTYNVIKLTSASKVSRGLDVGSSNPWTWVSGGTAVSGYQGVSFAYTSGLTNGDTGFNGDTQDPTFYSTGPYASMASDEHYALSVDLSFIAGKTATIHYTMECGNDDLMGRAYVPDTGSSVLMFGLALVGLAGFRRKLVR